MSLTQRLAELEIELPSMHGPFGAYVPAKRVGNLIYVAGQLPMKDGKLMVSGQVPTRCSVNAAKAGARQCVINALSSVKAVQGSLVSLTGVVRLGVFVSSEPGFHEQHKISNGASEFLIDLFGEGGHHVRTTVGVNSLPLDATVEIEFIFQAAHAGP